MEFGAKRCLLIWYLTTSGWWFGSFFIFHNIWDNPSHWLSYFSRLLLNHKPDMLNFDLSRESANSHLWVKSCFTHTTATAAPLYIFPNMFPECSHHFAMMFPTLPHSDPNLFLTFSQCFPNLSTHFPTIFTMICHKECGSKSSISHAPF